MNKRILVRASAALDWTLLTFFFLSSSYNDNRKIYSSVFLVFKSVSNCSQTSRLNLCTTVTLGNWWQGDRYIQGNRYIQVNFAENIPVRQLKIFGKLSGNRNIQGDRYIQVWLYMNKDKFDGISFQQAHERDCKRKPLNCPKNCGAVVPREEVRIKCCYYCSTTFVR